METNYSTYYQSQLEESCQYQDFVADKLYEHGIILINYTSKEYQQKKGENKLGLEIKHDKKFRTTGNFWIELKEKSNPVNASYVDSGIYRSDNTWIYAIGDYNTVYLFGKKMLSYLSSKYELRENNTKTSVGYLLPVADADKYCEKKINFT
jgi:hypothetical protein